MTSLPSSDNALYRARMSFSEVFDTAPSLHDVNKNGWFAWGGMPGRIVTGGGPAGLVDHPAGGMLLSVLAGKV